MRLSARTLHVDADKTSPPAAFATIVNTELTLKFWIYSTYIHHTFNHNLS